MADTVPTQSNLPLAGELQLVNWLNNLTGNKLLGSGMPDTATIPELSTEQMTGLMNEWLRGPGNFLENMRQQNLSGLYNTSTRQLVGNDLNAQAALKAVQANLPIKQANAQMINQMAIEKMRMLGANGSNSLEKTALAAGIAGLQKMLGGSGKGSGSGGGSGSGSSGRKDSKKDDESEDNIFTRIGNWYDERQVESTFNDRLQDPSFVAMLQQQIPDSTPLPVNFAPTSPLSQFQMTAPSSEFSTPSNPFLDLGEPTAGLDYNFGDWGEGVDLSNLESSFSQFDDSNFDFSGWANSFDWGSIGVDDSGSFGGGFDW